MNAPLYPGKLSKDLDKNIELFEHVFSGAGDYVKREFHAGQAKKIRIYIAYLDMLVDRRIIENQILTRILVNLDPSQLNGQNPYEAIKNNGMTTADISEKEKPDELFNAVLSGDAVLLIDGSESAIVISAKGWPNRGVPEVENEPVVFGPKESFSEVFRINSMLIRRRIKDTKLKLFQMKVGKRSKTDVGLLYIDGIVRQEILRNAMRRIEDLDIDALFDSAALEQLTEDDWRSPFPQAQLTERPDKAASAILEGRLAIIVDGSPFALIIPATLNVFYQASDDYYNRYGISSFVRTLRYVAGVIAIALPGFYLACAVYHPSMLPMLMIFKMAAARQNVPFPAVVEIIMMELAFELLREAGVRLPKPVGSSIGIIGGLIIGQAAVEAGLVSPIVVIAAAATGIAGFTMPNYSLQSGFRLSKYLITLMSAFMGFFGFWAAVILILTHLCSLKSYGIPYMFPFCSGNVNDYADFHDSLRRSPLFMMKKRPIFADPASGNRQNTERAEMRKKKR